MVNLYDLKKFDLNLLVIFECIYQHLSISKAAEALFITPSAVSQSLQRLRTQLNDPLFIRAGKGITPTMVGTNLHRHLEKNLTHLEQTINMMSRSELTKRFVLYGPQLCVLPQTLKMLALLQAQNNLEIEHYDILASKEMAEDLMNYRKADVVITTSPVTSRAVVSQPFATVDISLVCSRSHSRLAHMTHVEISDIAREGFTRYLSDEPSIREFRDWNENLFTGNRIVYRSNSLISILNMIGRSELVGFIPTFYLNHFKDIFNLHEVPTMLELPKLTMYLIYNRSSLNNPNFARVIEKMNNEE